MKGKYWWILAIVILGGVVVAVVFDVFAPGVPVETAVVRTGSIREYVDERAKTRLRETYPITMPYAARVARITLTENTQVRQGDPLAQLVSKDVEIAMAEAEATLAEIDAAIAQNDDTSLEKTALNQTDKFIEAVKAMTLASGWQMKSSLAALKYANADLQRALKLHEQKIRTDDELEESQLHQAQDEAGYQQATRTYQAAQWSEIAMKLMPNLINDYIERKKLQGEVLQKQRAQVVARLEQAQLNYARSTMASPVNGVVLNRLVTAEQPLPAGTALMEVGRLEDLEVEADVLSVDVVEARPGDRVEIYGIAIGTKPARGVVQRIHPAGFTKISSLGVEQQRVRVIVRFEPEDLETLLDRRNLGVGYDVRVRIVTAEKADALLIPRSALFRNTNGGWQVYAVVGSRAELRNVKVGMINDEHVEVVEGLKKGQRVILAPESNLADGTKVKVGS